MNAAVPENGNVRFIISQLHLPCEDEVRGWECCHPPSPSSFARRATEDRRLRWTGCESVASISFQCQCGIWKVGLMTVRSKSHFVSKRHRRKGAHVYPFTGEVAFSTVNNRWNSTFIGVSLIEFYEVFAENLMPQITVIPTK